MPDSFETRISKPSIWSHLLKSSADPERAKHFLRLLAATAADSWLEKVSADQARILTALFVGSRGLSERLISHPEFLEVLDPDALKYPRREQGLRQELGPSFLRLVSRQDFGSALSCVRQFKEREMLRIAARDLAQLANLPEIIQEISDVADVCLNSIWRVCHSQLTQRYGLPYHKDSEGRWQQTAGGVLGLGKLGGQELNYSSDVDVIFVYSEEGEVYKTPPGKNSVRRLKRTGRAGEQRQAVLTNHQFFNRLAEAFVAELTRVTPEGTLYRIDLRLRPEGEIGPLSRSLAGFENYYAQWGQTWERMMLIKARGVAGDAMLAAEFLEMIQPFRYPRSINESALREVGVMKDRIEAEVVKAEELERNVKLGRGGIREIEFVVQSLQLLHAGRQPFLQGPQTLPVLEKLVQYELLPQESARCLREAYVCLRNIEHRLQMEDNRQTHSIPADKSAQQRLARLMGFANIDAFEASRQKHSTNVRRIFESVLKKEIPVLQSLTPFPVEFAGAELEWKQILAAHAFRNVDTAFRVLREFVEGPGYVHVSPRTHEVAYQLLPRLFALCPKPKGQSLNGKGPGARARRPTSKGQTPKTKKPATNFEENRGEPGRIAKPPLSDPDRVITRLDNFISAYGARATLFELWHSNPAIFELLVLLFDRSEFLAELAIRTPDLVDELVISGRLRMRKSSQETLSDLRHGLNDSNQHLWVRRYHQAELMRIGLRDILGLADFEQYLLELSALADACLQYALEVVMRQHKLKSPPFVIIGLGKLGGQEIDYGSDLDIIFVARAGAQDLTRLSRMALEVMDLLTTRTEQGIVFHIDARLRPDGEKGLLVNSLDAYEQYYRRRAHLWEIQTLTRTRPITGDIGLGAQFQKLAAAITDFRNPVSSLAAYVPDWKTRIREMRMRIEKGRTPAGKDDLAIKTGSGGLMDAEFVAQALAMANGWQEPNTLRALERGRDSGALAEATKLIENYRRLRRVEGVLRRWSYEGETVLPDDPAPFYRVSVRCGFETSQTFREAIGTWRRAIREVYSRFFQTSQD
jgi:glutamate-ammonia-ligase adenylyltransferase